MLSLIHPRYTDDPSVSRHVCKTLELHYAKAYTNAHDAIFFTKASKSTKIDNLKITSVILLSVMPDIFFKYQSGSTTVTT